MDHSDILAHYDGKNLAAGLDNRCMTGQSMRYPGIMQSLTAAPNEFAVGFGPIVSGRTVVECWQLCWRLLALTVGHFGLANRRKEAEVDYLLIAFVRFCVERLRSPSQCLRRRMDGLCPCAERIVWTLEERKQLTLLVLTICNGHHKPNIYTP